MQERSVFTTYEAVYDVVETEEYIWDAFGESRAKRYYEEIRSKIKALSTNASFFGDSGFKYRGYHILKKPFSPGIIFYIIEDDGVHVLRVLREESDWQKYFSTHEDYEYSYPKENFV